MKRFYRGLPIFVWALLGILGLAAALLSLGERDDATHPAADSYGPSGTSALAELLRKQGYDVRIDRWPHPRLAAGDVAIACYVRTPRNSESQPDDFEQYLVRRVKEGVQAVELGMPSDFTSVSRSLLVAQPASVLPRGHRAPLHLDLGGSPPSQQMESVMNPDAAVEGLWDSQGGAVLSAVQLGSGRILVADGVGVTNRFIDRHDNARAVLDMVGMVAHPGGRVVFTEASFGDVVPPSLLETIGNWAYAGWQQLLFLGLVVIYTLGKRFGIPDETRPIQRGSRELLDALSDTYFRGKHTQAAMASAMDRFEVQLRAALRLPRDATFSDLSRRLPEELAQDLLNLRTACQSTEAIAPDEALNLVAKARFKTDAFLGKRRPAPL